KKSRANGGVGFSDYLIMPVQRIPRYNLLLKELIKHTHESHKDFKNLQKALEGTISISEFMNSKMEEENNRKKLFQISNRLKFKDLSEKKIILPHRRFVMEGYLTIIPHGGYNEEKKGWKRWFFFLFTDILLYCEADNGIDSEKYILG